ncbi:MAG TPA: hypothetical protein VML58_01230 [Burkholderiaceae bacterium]|nr:hypothetical protein [Burkholderiaceae bacterium]
MSSVTTLQLALVGDRDERIVAHRAIERTDHSLFVATLLQPERAGLRGEVPQLLLAFAPAAHAAAR